MREASSHARAAQLRIPHPSVQVPQPRRVVLLRARVRFRALLLTGCKPVGPNYNRPGYEAPAAYKETGATTVIVPPPNPAGGGWQPATPSDGMLRGKWWEIYQDPQLNQLEERIASRTTRACARRWKPIWPRATRSARPAPRFFPRSPPGLPSSRSKISANGPSYSAGKSTTYNDLRAHRPGQLGAGLLGPHPPHRRSRPRKRPGQRRRSWPAVDLSLHAEMAADYFQLRGLDSETKLLNATVADLERQLDLTQRRLAGGIGTEADVAQARTQLETVRAQLIDVGVARAQYRTRHRHHRQPAISPTSAFRPRRSISQPLPKVPVGVPSQLLERRPDIAAAERRAAAANAQIGIAVSAFYPTITLGGNRRL